MPKYDITAVSFNFLCEVISKRTKIKVSKLPIFSFSQLLPLWKTRCYEDFFQKTTIFFVQKTLSTKSYIFMWLFLKLNWHFVSDNVRSHFRRWRIDLTEFPNLMVGWMVQNGKSNWTLSFLWIRKDQIRFFSFCSYCSIRYINFESFRRL